MTTLIEKAARAAFPDAYISSGFSGAENAKKWADAKAAVRAMLMAIREPTHEMVSAPIMIADDDDSVAELWRVMIDTLLGEG